ncbi:MAG: hypothetical protein IJW18_09560, partial [Lachnospiraceae bacterium]|nr:hypothetical protein [Lachnospiraceae bacterium]
ATNNTFSLGEYANIKNGSYGKLLKAYYAKQEKEESAVSEETSKEIALFKNDADDLKKAMLSIMDEELYEKKEIKDKDGNVTKDYDKDAIVSAMKEYVKTYNDMVDRVANSDNKNVLRNGVWMTKATSVNEGLLSEVGIAIGEGNKLKLDEETLREASMTDLKSIFTGYNSYADDVLRNTNKIATALVAAASKTGSTYNGSAEIDKMFTSGLLYNDEM